MWTGMAIPHQSALISWNSLKRKRDILSVRNILSIRAIIITSIAFRARNLKISRHMDEKTPHMHLCFIPLTADGRLSAKEIVGNKKKLTQWQDQFWEYMVKKYPDLERGESASKTGRDHIPPRLFKEAVHLNRMKEQILKLMTDTNLLNKKSKMEELEALLDKYVPATEALRTKLRKYDKAYKALSDENSALEAELQTAKDASKEKIADRLKYGKTEQELCELHALIDNIPPEIVAAYRRKTTGLQNER